MPTREAIWLWRIIALLMTIISGGVFLGGNMMVGLLGDLKAANDIQNKDIRDIREAAIGRLAGERTPAEVAEMTAWRLSVERRLTQCEMGQKQ